MPLLSGAPPSILKLDNRPEPNDSLRVFSEEKNYPITQGEYVRFTIKNAGIEVDGEFESYKTKIQYDPNRPTSSIFQASIDVGSINTGIDLRDEHLKEKAEYFDVKRYPKIQFESMSCTLLTNGKLKVVGPLTIKDVTKVVTLIVDAKTIGSMTYFESEIKIDRMDYNVGESSWMMGDEVICALRVAAN